MLSKLLNDPSEDTANLLSFTENVGDLDDHAHRRQEREERNSRLAMSSSFSALYPGNSPQLTAFLLLNAMIGSGILNQAYVFRKSGFVGGLIGYFLSSVANWLGLVLMTAAGIHVDILEYSGLAKHAFPRYGEALVDLSIIVLSFGAQMGYILIVGTTISGLITSWGCDSIVCDDYFTTIIVVTCFVAPICMFRHFGHLAYLSLFSIGAIVAIIMLVLIAGPIKHQQDHDSDNYRVINVIGALSSTGSIVFTLGCAAPNFQAYVSTEKSAQNLDSWKYITFLTIIAGTVMCVTIGVAGYLSFSDNTEGMILDNFPQTGYDFFKIMVVAHLIFYIPVSLVVMRYSIVKLSIGKRSELLPFTTHTVLTLFLVFVDTATVLSLLSLGLASGEIFSLILDFAGGIGGECCNSDVVHWILDYSFFFL